MVSFEVRKEAVKAWLPMGWPRERKKDVRIGNPVVAFSEAVVPIYVS
jgi:hypothetical protein